MKRVLQLQKYTSLQYSAHLGLLQRTRLPGSASWALTESAAVKWCMVPGQQINDSANPNVAQNVQSGSHNLLANEVGKKTLKDI